MSGALLLAPGSRTLTAPGPLGKVLDALRCGANSKVALISQTKLNRDLVETALAHLTRTGHLIRRDYAECPTSGCGSCQA
jgi:hypothetical protein